MSNFSWSISQIRRGHLNFCAVKCKNLGLALLGFSVYSILGVKFDLILVLRSRFVEYLRETLYKHALEHLEAARSEKQRFFFSSYGKLLTIIGLLKACDWSGHIFGASASPRSFTKKRPMSPSSIVHGGQHDTKYVTLDLLLQAAFVADEIWSNFFEAAPT